MSASVGINLPQLGTDSLMRAEREYYFGPEAVSVNKIVASVDPSGLTTGTPLTLQTNASSLLLRRARIVTLVLTDASGGSGGLSVTVLVIGARWGIQRQEYITCTCTDGSATTAKSTGVFHEVLSVTPVGGLSTAASGDALTVGIDGTSFGLDFPIDNVNDVHSIINVSTNTEASPTAISSNTVDATPGPGGSFIKGITLATTDRWEVQYIKSRKQDFSGTAGVWR